MNFFFFFLLINEHLPLLLLINKHLLLVCSINSPFFLLFSFLINEHFLLVCSNQIYILKGDFKIIVLRLFVLVSVWNFERRFQDNSVTFVRFGLCMENLVHPQHEFTLPHRAKRRDQFSTFHLGHSKQSLNLSTT